MIFGFGVDYPYGDYRDRQQDCAIDFGFIEFIHISIV